MEKLTQIQNEIKVPKGQFNKFGGYKYRSCEDIMEALKPLLAKHKCSLVVTDDIIDVAGRIYVKATVQLSDGENMITVTSYAREAETKKGMDEAQITGSASSYARKYALAGMFLIDDTKDADATNDHGNNGAAKTVSPHGKTPLRESTDTYRKAIDFIAKGGTYTDIEKKYSVSDKVRESINAAVAAQTQKTEVL
jgi:hypothetical protein